MIRWGKEGGVNGVKARERMREDIEEDPARIYGSSGKRRRYQKLINGNYPQDEALENALTRSEKLSKDVILVLGYEREREQRAILISPLVRSVFSLKLSSFDFFSLPFVHIFLPPTSLTRRTSSKREFVLATKFTRETRRTWWKFVRDFFVPSKWFYFALFFPFFFFLFLFFSNVSRILRETGRNLDPCHA